MPGGHLNGYEVVAHFKANNFDNNGTFYTDSNGLEMQKRILNHRDYYDVNTQYVAHQNITANYYPINSAISIKDASQSIQFSVQNDRSQGGSSLGKGEVELMQNRRLPADDCKGVDENLNETDKNGLGIRVPASYYVQFTSPKQPSQQRLIQHLIDDPAQYFFTESAAKLRGHSLSNYKSKKFSE